MVGLFSDPSRRVTFLDGGSVFKIQRDRPKIRRDLTTLWAGGALLVDTVTSSAPRCSIHVIIGITWCPVQLSLGAERGVHIVFYIIVNGDVLWFLCFAKTVNL